MDWANQGDRYMSDGQTKVTDTCRMDERWTDLERVRFVTTLDND